MNNEQHSQLLNCISSIHRQSKDSKLSPELLQNLENELLIVSDYLETSTNESLLFSNIISLFFLGRDVEFSDLCRYFDMDTFDLLPHLKHLEPLISRGILIRKNGRRNFQKSNINKIFLIANELCDSIMRGDDCPKLKKDNSGSFMDILEEIHEFTESCINEECNIHELHEEIESTLLTYNHFEFIKNVRAFSLSETDLAVFLYVTWLTISGAKGVEIDRLLRGILGRNSEKVNYMQGMYNRGNRLISEGFLEYKESRFMNDIEFTLTDKSKIMLEKEGVKMTLKSSRRDDIIFPKSISEKNLFYNEDEKTQLNSIDSLLKEEQYEQLMNRLRGKNLPTSLNILLYGSPGTGKTETVLQLAKRSGREIIKVDISKTKSMWFGESEKIVKKIFTDYQQYSDSSALTPILLFNEADAILSSRGDISASNTKQTENAIQNILLEELENFKGIFIATTNLVKNLDRAFDRRFLFKLKFMNPSCEQRMAIWKDKLPFLDDDTRAKLASNYTLTGGQIENIVRKCEIDFILHGKEPGYESVNKFCSEESIVSNSYNRRIGF